MIHEKWLDFQESHQLVSCQLSRSKSANPRWAHDAFCCDHVIEHLHDLVLVGLKEDNQKKAWRFHRREQLSKVKGQGKFANDASNNYE